MKKQVMIALGLAAGLGTALAAWAQQPGRPEGPPPGGRREGPPPERRDRLTLLKQEVGLSDAQIDQLKKIHQDQRRAGIRRRADIQIARLDLRGLMGGATVDDKAVAAKVKELSDLAAAAIKARVDGHLAMRKVLTAEQFKKFQELQAHRAMMMRGRRGPDGPRPMGPGQRRLRRPGPGPQGAGEGDDDDDDEDPGQPLTRPDGR